MKISLVTPVSARSRRGNGVTARRWASILRNLGHEVRIERQYHRRSVDLLIALHAWRSAASVQRFHAMHSGLPIVVGMAGTDLYEHIHSREEARHSIEVATRIVVLQEKGTDELPAHLRHKARVIYQSVPPPKQRPSRSTDAFEISVLAHLRPVKDPLRAAQAARLLPADSRIQIRHAGAALDPEMEQLALAEADANRRYCWLGDLPHARAMRLLARSRLLVVSSRSEGGANVVSEALAADVPVVSSEIAGSIGILGADYPGYFPVEDTAALAALLQRCEQDEGFLESLRSRCRDKARLVEPAFERQAWEELLAELW